VKSLAEQLQDICDANGLEFDHVELTLRLRPKTLPLKPIEAFGEAIEDNAAQVIVLADWRAK